jgi:hypothetical protein
MNLSRLVPRLPEEVIQNILEGVDNLRRSLQGLGTALGDEEAATPRRKRRRPLSVGQADDRAMDLAREMGKEFLALSEREQARKIGCHRRTWRRTPFYQLIQEQRARPEAGTPHGPAVQSLSTGVEAGIGQEDESLQALLNESQADNKSDPSPLEPDPPDRPRKVRHRKRL